MRAKKAPSVTVQGVGAALQAAGFMQIATGDHYSTGGFRVCKDTLGAYGSKRDCVRVIWESNRCHSRDAEVRSGYDGRKKLLELHAVLQKAGYRAELQSYPVRTWEEWMEIELWVVQPDSSLPYPKTFMTRDEASELITRYWSATRARQALEELRVVQEKLARLTGERDALVRKINELAATENPLRLSA